MKKQLIIFIFWPAFVFNCLAADFFWVNPQTSGFVKHSLDIGKCFETDSIKQEGVCGFDVGQNTFFTRHSIWNVSDFTQGLIDSDSQYQASVNPTGYGSTSFQVKGDKFGAHLHTWSIPPTGMDYWSIGWIAKVKDTTGQVGARAWDSSRFGQNAQLCHGHFQTVPQHYSERNAALYIYTTFQLVDWTSNREFFLTINSWANHNLPNATLEGGYFDAHGNSAIGSHYGNSTKFTTIMPSSHTFSREPYLNERWFGVCITKENLVSMARTLNTLNGTAIYSINPEHYAVSGIAIQPEVANRFLATSNGWFSMTARERWLFTRN